MCKEKTTGQKSRTVSPTKVITGKCTFSYLCCWEPRSVMGGKPRYSVSLVIPKKDRATVEKIHAAIRAAYEEGRSKLQGTGKTVPALTSLRSPLRDGDLERPGDETYAGCWFLNAKSDEAPGIVDANRSEILDHSEMYSGVRGRASVSFYAYNFGGSRGIACSLNHLQKLEDGDRLGGRASAASDFADDYEDDEDEEDFPF